MPANDLAFIDMLWADWSPGFSAADDIENVKRCLREPENLTAALGYYRATLGDAKKDPAVDDEQRLCFEAPPQPTLYLHGVNDGCCGKEVAESAQAMCPSVNVTFVDGAGHFLQVEQPAIVNRLVVDWVTAK